jgi:hypothetical protein
LFPQFGLLGPLTPVNNRNPGIGGLNLRGGGINFGGEYSALRNNPVRRAPCITRLLPQVLTALFSRSSACLGITQCLLLVI